MTQCLRLILDTSYPPCPSPPPPLRACRPGFPPARVSRPSLHDDTRGMARGASESMLRRCAAADPAMTRRQPRVDGEREAEADEVEEEDLGLPEVERGTLGAAD